MKPSKFKDHFSSNSAGYNKFRPDYPDALFKYLSSISPSQSLAWDCATGSGQAAIQAAHYFKQVIATDASRNQLQHAPAQETIQYGAAYAENAPIQTGSIDLITVAQALHWFDTEAFFAEAKRVLRKNGIVAVWTYGLLSITPEVDAIIGKLYHETVGAYWPPERRFVEKGYGEIDLPFPEIHGPRFHMTASWSMEQLVGYLNTWSAVKRYQENNPHNPVEPLMNDLFHAWGDTSLAREVFWPLSIKIGTNSPWC